MDRATRTPAIVEPDGRTPEWRPACPAASAAAGFVAVGVASAASRDAAATVSRAP